MAMKPFLNSLARENPLARTFDIRSIAKITTVIFKEHFIYIWQKNNKVLHLDALNFC
jgi:hypothetical protein